MNKEELKNIENMTMKDFIKENEGKFANSQTTYSPWGNTDPMWLSLLLLALQGNSKDYICSRKDLSKMITDSDLSNSDKKSILDILMK